MMLMMKILQESFYKKDVKKVVVEDCMMYPKNVDALIWAKEMKHKMNTFSMNSMAYAKISNYFLLMMRYTLSYKLFI